MRPSPVRASSARSSASARRAARRPPGSGVGLLLELGDDLRGGRRADVGHDQRLLQALPGLVVDVALEQRRLDLGRERHARLGHVVAQAAEEAPLGLRGLGLLGDRDGAGRGLAGDEQILPVPGHVLPTYPPVIEIRAVRSDRPPADALVAEMVAELEELYGPMALRRTPTAGPGELWTPGGTYLVVSRTKNPSPAAAVKALGPGTGEIKRCSVRPGARGRGPARTLLLALPRRGRGLRPTRCCA
jgi:hypothetical protein